MLGNALCYKLGCLLEFLACQSCREFFARGFTSSPLQGSGWGMFPSKPRTLVRCLVWQRAAVASGRAVPRERGGNVRVLAAGATLRNSLILWLLWGLGEVCVFVACFHVPHMNFSPMGPGDLAFWPVVAKPCVMMWKQFASLIKFAGTSWRA